jgi:F-type H+-transporting ATPase subunit gamma
MKSLAEIRKSIKSIKSTQTITKTMKMVASARIKKAQKLILQARPFSDELVKMITEIQTDLSGENELENFRMNIFFDKVAQSDNIGLLVISSDRGLCGAFNTLLLRQSLEWIKARGGKKIFAFIVGRKALNFLGRLKGFDIEVIHQMTGIFPKASYANARIIGESIMQTYRSKKLSLLAVIYNEFTSMLTQTVKTFDFLPLGKTHLKKEEEKPRDYDFVYEPDKRELLNALVPRYINALIYKILLESQAAELAARMNAMDSASKNAADLIEDLTVRLNRIRQELITTEIAEIVGGMEALKG